MARNIIGSNGLKITTVENEQIVPQAPQGWTVPIAFRSFTFMNTEECHIVLNGNSRLGGEENVIYLRPYQGFSVCEEDVKVFSFIIKEVGVEYNWVGKY